ncbi:MAG: response regulator transcription factor [Lachnospiraceae bacterium]|nr:response regulator transcription factor [Lachnospiraceae bacterium]
MRILIAEDDVRLLKSLVHILKMNNFSADGVDNGDDALEYAMTGEYDGLILDIMMPKMDGIQVLRKLRENSLTTPALFLTAKSSISQRVEGLDAGADDYLPKPFSTDELLARVRAMLRRRDSFVPDLLRYGSVILNRSTYELAFQNRSIPLSGKEFQVMEILMENPHMVVTTEQLIMKIWGWNTAVDTSVVWVHISNLRKKLAALSVPVSIRFQRGVGYILEGGE